MSRRLAHGDQAVRRGCPALGPDRGRLITIPLGPGPSLHGLRRKSPSIVRPLLGYYATSHPRACSSFGFTLHEPAPYACPDTDEISQVPYKERLHVHGVSDCARSIPCSPSNARDDVAFSSTERDRHLGNASFAAQYPAHGLPCERFTSDLTGCRASLGVGAAG